MEELSMFRKLFLYDIIQGFRQNRIKLGIIFIGAFVFCLELSILADGMQKASADVPDINLGTYLLHIFAGMRFFEPIPGEYFRFPIKWMLFYSFLFFSVLNYPQKDLQGMGVNYIVKSRKRWIFWISKCIWTILFVLSCFFIMFLVMIGFCLFKGKSFSLLPDVFYLEYFNDKVLGILATPEDFVPALVVMPIVMTIALALFQQMLMLFIKPLFSYLVTEGILLASAGTKLLILPGNYMMALRNDILVSDGYSIQVGLYFATTILMISIVAGLIRFKKYDIMV
ncbi:MAG: hypothetical protein SPF70_10925 [Lachnospiraceae bacterium]|nr:hypothetical protein [Lachnospiraceae bacterium]